MRCLSCAGEILPAHRLSVLWRAGERARLTTTCSPGACGRSATTTTSPQSTCEPRGVGAERVVTMDGEL